MGTRLMEKDTGFEIKKNRTASNGAVDQVEVPKRMLVLRIFCRP